MGRVLIIVACVLGSAVSAEAQFLVGHTGTPCGIPNLCATPTHTAVQDGAWSDTATWGGDVPDTDGDRVYIPPGIDVTYAINNTATQLFCLHVAGSITFTPTVTTHLQVQTIYIATGGAWTQGTAAGRYDAGFTSTITFPDVAIDTDDDPEQWTNGFLAVGGTVRIFGAAKTSFLELAAVPAATDTSYLFGSPPSGWLPADILGIPDTRHLDGNTALVPTADGGTYVWQGEFSTIDTVSGTTVNLTAGLSFAHPAARLPGAMTGGLASGTVTNYPHVANFTRNVRFVSANPSGARGHMAFLASSDVWVEDIEINGLGRTTEAVLNSTVMNGSCVATSIGTNQIGRYPAHLHHLHGPASPQSDGRQFNFNNSALRDTKKWGLVTHNSHYGDVEWNVVSQGESSGIVAEDGSETDVKFNNNFAFRFTGCSDGCNRESQGRECNVYWAPGVNYRFTNNIAANCTNHNGITAGFGFNIAGSHLRGQQSLVRYPKAQGNNPQVAGEYVEVYQPERAFLEWANNFAYGAMYGGILFYDVGASYTSPKPNAAPSTFNDLTCWHLGNVCVAHYYSSSYTIDGLIVRGSNPEHSSGGYSGNDYTGWNNTVKNFEITATNSAIYPTVDCAINRMPSDTLPILPNVFEDGYISGYIGVFLDTQTQANAIETNGDCYNIFRNVTFEPMTGYESCCNRPYTTRYFGTSGVKLHGTLETKIYQMNGDPGENYEVFFQEQAPGFTMLQSVVPGAGCSGDCFEYGNAAGALMSCEDRSAVVGQTTAFGFARAGTPVSGKTNQQCKDDHGFSINGKLATCATNRAWLTATNSQTQQGFGCAIAPESTTIYRLRFRSPE